MELGVETVAPLAKFVRRAGLVPGRSGLQRIPRDRLLVLGEGNCLHADFTSLMIRIPIVGLVLEHCSIAIELVQVSLSDQILRVHELPLVGEHSLLVRFNTAYIDPRRLCNSPHKPLVAAFTQLDLAGILVLDFTSCRL